MLSIFKKIFGKSEPKQPLAPRVVMPRAVAASPHADVNVNQPRPQVEVAHLSLAAILTKLPEDLRRNVVHVPDPSVTVALPIATIHKQLPSGSVKMSLASLYRQAPAGVFAQARMEDKRMVEIPLQEVFRHVKPQGLRRQNQRRVDLPSDAPELFSDRENPYVISPGVPTESESEPEAEMAPPPQVPQIPRALKPPMDNGMAPAPQAVPRAVPRAAASPQAAAIPTAKVAPAAAEQAPLVLPLSSVCEAWPEPIRSEALSMEGATVSLPVSLVTAGVAKGKVAFSWGQIRSWMNPPADFATQAREATELLLPLKVVAPAFLAHQRPATPSRKKFQMDESIPALFSGGEPARPASAPAPAPAPVAEPEPEPDPVATSAPASIPAPMSLVAPVLEPPAVEPEPEPESEAIPETIFAPARAEVAAPVAEPAAPAVVEGHAPISSDLHSPKSIAEILGCPEKVHWTPLDLLKASTTLPGVKGAVIGLHEGLLVAAELPDEVKGDTVAAFLPQMFARLNNYAAEMKLGEIDELLFTMHNAHFQAYRLGEVYLGILGKPGESLPWEGLRLIADQLARQTSK